MIVTKDIDKAIDVLASGRVAVIRTDTIYGIVALASNQDSAERIFMVKGRRPNKPLIVLIDNVEQMFELVKDDVLLERINEFWPGPYSIIFNAVNSPDWLTRKSGTIAYRIPDDKKLRKLIREVGPIVAPSANPEGLEPASSIEEAVSYFGNKVDAYVDGGEVRDAKPSSLIRIESDGTIKKLR